MRRTTSPLPTFKNFQWQDLADLKEVLQKAGFPANKTSLSEQEVFSQIKDLHRWAQVLWALMGRPADGWVEGDEENWDHAVETIEQRIVKTEEFYFTEKREPQMRTVADIAIVTK